MTPGEMGALIEAHLRAEGNGHPEGTVAQLHRRHRARRGWLPRFALRGRQESA
jgi:hypothetical protein